MSVSHKRAFKDANFTGMRTAFLLFLNPTELRIGKKAVEWKTKACNGCDGL